VQVDAGAPVALQCSVGHSRRIPIKGYRVDRSGRLAPDDRHLYVCTRLKRKGRKRVVSAGKAALSALNRP